MRNVHIVPRKTGVLYIAENGVIIPLIRKNKVGVFREMDNRVIIQTFDWVFAQLDNMRLSPGKGVILEVAGRDGSEILRDVFLGIDDEILAVGVDVGYEKRDGRSVMGMD